MSNVLRALDAWAGALLANLQPAQRSAINHKVPIDLRRSHAQRIKMQQGSDDSDYPMRKRREEFKRNTRKLSMTVRQLGYNIVSVFL